MSIEDYDFIVFLDADWDEVNRRNRQHFLIAELSRQLEGHSKVFGIERPVCPWTGPFRNLNKFRRWLRGGGKLRQAGPNLYIYTPFVIVHNLIAAHISGMAILNRHLLRRLLERALKRSGFRLDNLIIWLHHPYQLEDLGLLGKKLVIYDCYDDYFSQAKGWWLADLRRREKAILAQSDLVFVASERLVEVMGDRAQRVQLVPNGVNADLFVSSICIETEVPSEIAILPRPVVGFVGKVTPRLDFALLAKLATRHPEWSFVLAGFEEDSNKLRGQLNYTNFRNAPNVHFLGPKPYESLPGYLKGCDVCIIPYACDSFNLGSSPLKLYEYLATGKPIVSTDLPAMRPFDRLVRIAENINEFERAIVASLAEDNEMLRKRRLAAARENSWEVRAETVLSIIETILKEKKS